MAGKDPSSLLKGGASARPQRRAPPLTVVLDNLAVTEGKALEILTRTTPELARAALVGFIFNSTIIEEGFNAPGCPYVRDRIEQVERFAVSIDAQGREDQIEALRAAGGAETGGASSFDEVERCRGVPTKAASSSTVFLGNTCTW